VPSRTSAPYVAPAPPPATKVAVPNGVPLLTGTPHREADQEGGYVVRRGDALWDVAARHLGPNATAADIAREWPRWYAANRAVIGTDPNLLRPGEVLHAPSA
jgi:resuscitation-promoting factor RpfA